MHFHISDWSLIYLMELNLPWIWICHGSTLLHLNSFCIVSKVFQLYLLFKVLLLFAFPCANKHQVSHVIFYFASPLNNKMLWIGAIVVWYSGIERIVEKASIRLPELLHIHVSPPELLSWLISGLFQHSVSGQFIGMNHSHGNCNLEQRCTGAQRSLSIVTELNRLKSDQLSPKKTHYGPI